jgi:hypothetical protein
MIPPGGFVDSEHVSPHSPIRLCHYMTGKEEESCREFIDDRSSLFPYGMKPGELPMPFWLFVPLWEK